MKPPEVVAREIMKQYARSGCLIDVGSLEAAITAALTAERQRLKDAEKWMRHLPNCDTNDPYYSLPCTCGLDDFRKERER